MDYFHGDKSRPLSSGAREVNDHEESGESSLLFFWCERSMKEGKKWPSK